MAALDISAMMWHIICGYIEGGQLPLSGDEVLDREILSIYELQEKVSFENFLFGRLLCDFYPVAHYEKPNFKRSSYYKIWTSIIQYVCDVWRIRGELVSTKLQNTKKFKALQEVDSILENNDITYVKAGDKSLLTKYPDRGWPLNRIESWLKCIRTSIDIGKRFASKDQLRITAFIQKK